MGKTSHVLIHLIEMPLHLRHHSGLVRRKAQVWRRALVRRRVYQKALKRSGEGYSRLMEGGLRA